MTSCSSCRYCGVIRGPIAVSDVVASKGIYHTASTMHKSVTSSCARLLADTEWQIAVAARICYRIPCKVRVLTIGTWCDGNDSLKTNCRAYAQRISCPPWSPFHIASGLAHCLIFSVQNKALGIAPSVACLRAGFLKFARRRLSISSTISKNP